MNKHMMKSRICAWLMIGYCSLLALSCNTGKKLLQKGNYYEAVMKSVDKLRSSPNNDKARETLADAYPFAVNFLMDKIDSEKASMSDFQNTQMVYIYEDLNALYESIRQAPAAREVIPKPKKYYAQLARVKPKAAEEQYLTGMEQLDMGSRENAKEAYYYFKEANKFVPNYKDVSNRIKESYNMAILKVLTNLTPVQSRTYDLSADLFYDEVDKVLREIEQNEFIRFFTRQQARKGNLSNPDQFLVINFEDFVVGETHTQERIEKLERDSVKLSTITLDDGSKRDVFGKVKAELTVNRMEIISKGLTNLTITHGGFDKRILLKEDFGGQYVWFNEWGNFNGDERALTNKQLAICKAKQVAPIPPQQMFIEFTKPIYEQLRSKLIGFYDGY